MKDEILQIAYSLEKGIIDEGTAKQELCVLLGVSQQRELLRFMEWLSTYWGIDEVIDCTKHQNIVEQYKP